MVSGTIFIQARHFDIKFYTFFRVNVYVTDHCPKKEDKLFRGVRDIVSTLLLL